MRIEQVFPGLVTVCAAMEDAIVFNRKNLPIQSAFYIRMKINRTANCRLKIAAIFAKQALSYETTCFDLSTDLLLLLQH